MRAEITQCRAMPNYRLWLRFDDGVEGTVDLSHLVGRGVFAPWSDPAYFARVTVDAQSRTVCWPNGADLDPYVLRSRITGEALPGSQPQSKAAS